MASGARNESKVMSVTTINQAWRNGYWISTQSVTDAQRTGYGQKCRQRLTNCCVSISGACITATSDHGQTRVVKGKSGVLPCPARPPVTPCERLRRVASARGRLAAGGSMGHPGASGGMSDGGHGSFRLWGESK